MNWQKLATPYYIDIKTRSIADEYRRKLKFGMIKPIVFILTLNMLFDADYIEETQCKKLN